MYKERVEKELFSYEWFFSNCLMRLELDTLAQDYEEEKSTKNLCFSSKNDKDNIKILIK